MTRYLKRGVCEKCSLDLLVLFRFKNAVKAYRCPAPSCAGVMRIEESNKRDELCLDFDKRLRSRKAPRPDYSLQGTKGDL